jgi:Uma2 family endonuclease
LCRLAASLIGIFGARRVRVQLPVEPAAGESSRSLPEPDAAVTREPEAAYRSRHPGPADILLVAEVSDSTLEFDMKRKGRLYANSNFPEYLLIDLFERQLLVFRAPRDGVYTEIRVLRPGDSFTPLSAPESAVSVGELLPE